MNQQHYEESRQHSRDLANKMRSNSVGNIIAGNSSTHYIDSLERFQKDYSVFDKNRREEEKNKKMQDLERKRIQYLERENMRWEATQQIEAQRNIKLQNSITDVQQGKKKSINSNGLAYNPINLTYDKNPEGDRLRLRDEDHKVRGYVRAYNMDTSGNSAYNPLNGEERGGVNKIVPNELTQRYQERLLQFEEGKKIQLPDCLSGNRNEHTHYL